MPEPSLTHSPQRTTMRKPRTEYVELAPENRLGVGATKEHVIISDNLTRTTIEITHDLASDLITALLMVKSHREDNHND